MTGRSQDRSAALSRRHVLQLAGAGVVAGLAGGSLSACGSDEAAANSLTVGSFLSDPAPKASIAELMTAATASSGVQISVNTTDANTFQNNINSYLQGTPDDIFTWLAGYSMQTFAKKGLLSPVDDVWAGLEANFPDSAKQLAKGDDGKYYFVPLYSYPWVVFYNKSTFKANGYEVPKTWDELISLCRQMQGDGLVPVAFGQKGGWPALGTFDIINLRLNGYDFHMQLMKHQVPWTDSRVTNVFDQWSTLMPYVQPGANGRRWQDAAKTLESKQAGMMFQGANQLVGQYVTDGADLADLDFFVYPQIDPQWGQSYMDAPTDGFCMTSKAKHTDAAKKVLGYLGTTAAAAEYLKTNKWNVAATGAESLPTYNAIQQKSVKAIQACTSVTQFFDRDSDPGFADNLAADAMYKFIDAPTPETVRTIQSTLEAQAKATFGV